MKIEIEMEESLNNNIQSLKWDKDVTLKNVDEFRLAIWMFLGSEKMNLILDLSSVTYLNSAALGVIADAVLSSSRYSKKLVIAGIESTVEEIFKIVHFSTFMEIFPEVEEAYIYFQVKKE